MPGKRAEGVSLRKFGVEDELWEKALAKAKTESRSLSSVLREFLREYVKS